MTAIYTWLLKMTGGDETRATIVAVSIAVFGSVVLGVAIFYGIGFVAERLPARKNRCPGCGRRTMIVCWFDEFDEDEEGVDYVYFRCVSCAARYRQFGDAWEDASDAKFDTMFDGTAAADRAESLWDRDLDR